VIQYEEYWEWYYLDCVGVVDAAAVKIITGSMSSARASLIRKTINNGKVDEKKQRKDIIRIFRS
jgi:hypothetical protein